MVTGEVYFVERDVDLLQDCQSSLYTVFVLFNAHCAEVMIGCAFINRQQKTHVFHIKELKLDKVLTTRVPGHVLYLKAATYFTSLST